MAQTIFSLSIARVNESLFSGHVLSVTVPGSEGQFTVLAHHEPLISQLTAGTIVVHTEGQVLKFEIEKGMLEVSNNQVTVLV